MATKSTAVKLTLKITSFIVRLLLNIVFYVLVVILIVNISKKAFEFTYEIYGPVTVDTAPGRDIIFQITKGESRMDIASKLEVNRAVKSKYSFFLKTKLQEYVIMPGTYVINSSMTYDEILTVITDYTKSIVKEEDITKSDTGSDTNTDSDTDTGANTDAENASQ